MNWFDLVLLGLLALSIISGFRRGLVKQLFSLFGFIIALALAFFGSRMLSGTVAAYLDPNSMIPYQEALQLLGAEAAVERAMELVAGAVTFLALLVVLLILFRFFSGGFKWVNRIPIIGIINRLGGALIGLVVGGVFAYLLLGIFSLVPLPYTVEAVQGSRLAFWAEAYLPLLTATVKEYLMNFYLDTVVTGGH
jgi:uncharacterized membrane protein required for colicin V production